MTRFSMVMVLIASCATLAGCGGSAAPSLFEELTQAAELAPASASAADVTALATPPDGQQELVQNGLFDEGTQGWTQSTRRGEWGTSGAIIGDMPTGAPLPLNGRTTVARLCGYPTERITDFEISRGTCNDMLSTTVEVPAGASNLRLQVSAWAKYDCGADQHGAFTLALSALDGLGNPTPRAMSFKELQLPAGEWRDLTVPIGNVSGLATQARSLKLVLMFSTGTACKPPLDTGTYVLVTDISARVDRP